MELEPLAGVDLMRRRGATRTLFIYFTSLQLDWDQNSLPWRFDFVNTAIKYNQNAIFVRDRSNLWYQYGLPHVAQNVVGLAKIIKDETRSFDRIVCIGPSMGGYAALLFGHLLEADLAFGISPQIRIGRTYSQELSDPRFEAWYAPLESGSPTPQFFALDQVLPVEGYVRYHVIVGSDAWVDHQHANLISSRPDFKLIQAENCGHNDVGAWCLNHNLFFDID
ncbi:alpha/beta hydrolase [Methylobacterium haplocladii]|uniref:Alpha/beta hydrolase n=1 Tax=Methylobacterium haplocladii TaxID=1176176 RepID=A0A512IW42_9HYPH|nr:alpha/beta hydrolase [Methylobacterium haplocladii]GEP01937.1 hypothetical protein MHA02_43240 [Methylobacterium haplocladii]GJD86398.1 hypothetical protein HPGCJGGD_4304 [Methylobacterium haplocladii]GLS61377.1 hypothetical protein GCM10007887_40850 [Methylobacterium haplocladii]